MLDGTGRDGTGGGADKGAGGAGLAEGAGRRQQRRRRGVSQAGGTLASEARSGSEEAQETLTVSKVVDYEAGPGCCGVQAEGLGSWGAG